MEKERQPGLDLVRAAAIFFVIVLHGITMRGALDAALLTPVWCAKVFVRYLALSAVPLFLMLSGYLQAGKRPTKAYYRGILPLYLSYFAIAALCMAARIYRTDPLSSVWTALYKILDFSADGYAWYFEMYIGLFLLIPFLNLAYAHIPTRTGKRLLLASLVFLTLMPETLVSFAPYYGGGSLNLRILPDFFESLYPITFYFVGSYVGEYRPRLCTWQRLLFVPLSVVLPTALCIGFTAARGEYAWYMMNGFSTLTVLGTATAVFLTLYDLPVRTKAVRCAAAAVSHCTFEMYLLSYLWDQLLYGRLSLPLSVTVLLVLVTSFCSAWLLRLVLHPAARGLCALYDKLLKIA